MNHIASFIKGSVCVSSSFTWFCFPVGHVNTCTGAAGEFVFLRVLTLCLPSPHMLPSNYDYTFWWIEQPTIDPGYLWLILGTTHYSIISGDYHYLIIQHNFLHITKGSEHPAKTEKQVFETLNTQQGALYYQPKQCTITREILQNDLQHLQCEKSTQKWLIQWPLNKTMNGATKTNLFPSDPKLSIKFADYDGDGFKICGIPSSNHPKTHWMPIKQKECVYKSYTYHIKTYHNHIWLTIPNAQCMVYIYPHLVTFDGFHVGKYTIITPWMSGYMLSPIQKSAKNQLSKGNSAERQSGSWRSSTKKSHLRP